jgi:glycosyltransferase involved in cell wall biosynthesis
MQRRLKVLVSAYACEPGKGSEPEVGWQWAMQMARFHEVTVLTRANNRQAIEKGLKELPREQPVPRFVYHDRSEFLLSLKDRTRSIQLYYLLWQRSAREVIASLHDAHQFDLMHHVTFAAFRYPTAVWGHGAPVIWGPVGGIESIPARLLPWDHPRSLAHELLRNFSNVIQSAPYHVLPRRAGATTLILSSTVEMQQKFARLGFASEVMPTIGLKTQTIPYTQQPRREGPLRLLFVGNIITLKGIDLAIEALKQSGIEASFTLIGGGNYVAAAQRRADRLGLGERVRFLGRLPRQDVLRSYPGYDVFVFPSLHDTGGYAVIEAMLNGLPVVCLDCGGPAVAVHSDCGFKIPLGSRPHVIAGLADALKQYDRDRLMLEKHGQAAREVVLKEYDWDRKGEQMNERYQQALQTYAVRAEQSRASSYSGMGGLTSILHRFFSFKGAAVSVIGLFLVAALGFFSIGHLKEQARRIVNDTLPGLSFAGEANSSIAEAFNRTLLLVMSDNLKEQEQLKAEVESFSDQTTKYLNAYKEQIFAAQDLANFQDLLRKRAAYSRVRGTTIALAETNRLAARQLLLRELLPVFASYKEAGDKLFEFNMRQGTVRGHSIMQVCTTTQFVVAVVAVLIFVIGFFLGVAR